MSEPDPQWVSIRRQILELGSADDPDAEQILELEQNLFARYLQLQRGGVTPGGLPYPDPLDPVAEGADAIRALAAALDPAVADTDWQPVPLDTTAYVAGNGLAHRRIGHLVIWRGTIGRSTNWPTGNPTPVPVLDPLFRPYGGAYPWAGFLVASNFSNGARVVIQNSVIVQANTALQGTTAAVWMSPVAYFAGGPATAQTPEPMPLPIEEAS